jgi:hypothetical protein
MKSYFLYTRNGFSGEIKNELQRVKTTLITKNKMFGELERHPQKHCVEARVWR